MVVDSKESGLVSVTSGVQQSSVLGPILVLVYMYINDLPENIISQVRLFADDTVVYLISEGANDSFTLQNDTPVKEKVLKFWYHLYESNLKYQV